MADTQTDPKLLVSLPRSGGETYHAALGAGPGAPPEHLRTPLPAGTPAADAATLLREPGSRLLSLYAELRTDPAPAPADAIAVAAEAADAPLDAFLADPRAAALTDNALARLLLAGDPRLPEDGFMRQADADAVAREAIAALDAFGCVAVLERGDDAAARLGAFFGVSLEVRRPEPREEVRDGSVPFPPFTAEAFALLSERCAADAQIYEHVAAAIAGGDEAARGLSEMALVQQLVRIGDRGGVRAARSAEAGRATDTARAAAEAAARREASAAAAARSEAESLRAERDRLDAEAAAARAEAEAARAEAEAAQAEADGLRAGDEARAGRQSAELVRLGTSHAELEVAHAALQDEHEALRDAYEETRDQFAALQSSASWLVTAPLRLAQRGLGGIIRR
ncbi:hypothetical protein NBH00_14995 [Paraconexibacter antarcticus]|uniref:Uncharacterized protein n=1 Tax=Paraconexibacter antarcticus TaxID=2949664 RepID=A0ABY5DMM9_9ACTN|nr:hypothetical protein [Paraconexibacter antarcticus]UTI62665.1 hypothetical protein NBH00_14995 [Paraconexibacter antarcticus]